MTNIKLSVVQKARYVVLFFPFAFLLFSVFAVISMISPQRDYAPAHNVESPLSARGVFIVAGSGYCTLWTVVKILRKVKQGVAISVELKSGLALFLGLTIWRFLPYVGLICLDIAAIIMLITLLQGKRFGPYTLYHKDVQIEKIP